MVLFVLAEIPYPDYIGIAKVTAGRHAHDAARPPPQNGTHGRSLKRDDAVLHVWNPSPRDK